MSLKTKLKQLLMEEFVKSVNDEWEDFKQLVGEIMGHSAELEGENFDVPSFIDQQAEEIKKMYLNHATPTEAAFDLIKDIKRKTSI